MTASSSACRSSIRSNQAAIVGRVRTETSARYIVGRVRNR
jgi:hypothetical protein